jgi:exopolysaccharide biosynthesis protein
MLKGEEWVLRKVLEEHGLLCRTEKDKGVVILQSDGRTLETIGIIIEDKASL